MTFREWKHFTSELLDSVERELHPDAPAEDRDALQTLRSSLERRRVTQARKPFERKIDRLIESRPYLFAAAHRHIGKILPQAVEQAASTMKRARDLLDRAPNTALEPTPTAP
jgi:prephenate dehydrogenase